MTYRSLIELLGDQEIPSILGLVPFAVSNVFYEQLYLHYDLESVSRKHEQSFSGREAAISRKRGDILEAYMAAIQMDTSRGGKGDDEIHRWLRQVLAIRLRLADTSNSPSDDAERETRPVPFSPRRLSWRSLSPPSAETSSALVLANSPAGTPGHTDDDSMLPGFRRSMFTEMKKLLTRIYSSVKATLNAQAQAFWIAMKCYMDGLTGETDEIRVLIHYYRVRPDFLSTDIVVREYPD